MNDFDPLQAWLHIPPREQPPDHYRLLGLARFEAEEEQIARAVAELRRRLLELGRGPQGPAARELLAQVEAAGRLLLHPHRKARYDSDLRAAWNETASGSFDLDSGGSAAPLKSPPFEEKHPFPLTRSAWGLPAQRLNPAAAEGEDGTPESRRGAFPTGETAYWSPIVGGLSGLLLVLAVIAGLARLAPSPPGFGADGNPLVGNAAPGNSAGSDAARSDSTAESRRHAVGHDAREHPAADPLPVEQIAANRVAAGELPTAADSAPRRAVESLLRAAEQAESRAERQAHYALARDRALAAGELELALAALLGWGEELPRREGLELILTALETLRRGEAEADWSLAVREAESAAREAARLEEFPLARRGVRAALGVAARSGQEELVRRAETLEEAVTAEELRWLAYRQAYQRLDLDPADPAANGVVGRYLCFVYDDFATGLRHLALADDSAYRELARRESLLEPGRDPTECREVAQLWREAAERESPAWRASCRARAEYWLARAGGNLEPANTEEPAAEPPRGESPSSPEPPPTLRRAFVWDPELGVVNGAAFSDDGLLLAAAGENGVRVRPWETEREAAHVTGERPFVAVAFLRGDALLATLDGEGEVQLWEWETGRLRRNLRGPGRLTCLAAGRGGELHGGTEQGDLVRWSSPSEAAPRRVHAHGGPVHALLALPDGRLVSAGDDGAVRVWSAEGKVERNLVGPSRRAVALAVSPSGMLAAGAADETARLWRAAGDHPAVTLRAHRGAVLALGWPAGDRWAVTAGEDGVVRLWNAEEPRVLAARRDHRGAIRALAVHPTEPAFVTAGDDGLLRGWTCLPP